MFKCSNTYLFTLMSNPWLKDLLWFNFWVFRQVASHRSTAQGTNTRALSQNLVSASGTHAEVPEPKWFGVSQWSHGRHKRFHQKTTEKVAKTPTWEKGMCLCSVLATKLARILTHFCRRYHCHRILDYMLTFLNYVLESYCCIMFSLI